MLLYFLSQPVELEGGWWAQSPLRRDTLILPDDSVPKEKNAKIVIKAYQRFYFARPKSRSIAGATLIAGQRWIEEGDLDMKRRYEEMGYKFGERNSYYDLYYYPIPMVDSLIVYVRSKEKYCSLVMGMDIRMVDDTGGVIEGAGWKVVKVVIRRPNTWTKGVIYLPDVLVPADEVYLHERVYGLRFSIGPDRGSTDSCASFEVGPIYFSPL
ncbi:MAG: hypothetical protein GXO39_01780 [Thermotogae bacterium]|nr:hypothetical protein [Thermotogota bacterium]